MVHGPTIELFIHSLKTDAANCSTYTYTFRMFLYFLDLYTWVADEQGANLIVQSWLYGGNMGPICKGHQVTLQTFSGIILIGPKCFIQLFVFLKRRIRHIQ